MGKRDKVMIKILFMYKRNEREIKKIGDFSNKFGICVISLLIWDVF